MTIIRIWKEPKSRFTWRHLALLGFWIVTVIPVMVIIMIAYLAGPIEAVFSRIHVWANHDAYIRYSKKDYLNADHDSITQPYPGS